MTATAAVPTRERRRLESVWNLASRLELVASSRGLRVYSVPSSSRPDTSHTVTLRQGERPRCTCECGEIGRHACVHIGAAYLSRAWARALHPQFPAVCRMGKVA